MPLIVSVNFWEKLISATSYTYAHLSPEAWKLPRCWLDSAKQDLAMQSAYGVDTHLLKIILWLECNHFSLGRRMYKKSFWCRSGLSQSRASFMSVSFRGRADNLEGLQAADVHRDVRDLLLEKGQELVPYRLWTCNHQYSTDLSISPNSMFFPFIIWFLVSSSSLALVCFGHSDFAESNRGTTLCLESQRFKEMSTHHFEHRTLCSALGGDHADSIAGAAIRLCRCLHPLRPSIPRGSLAPSANQELRPLLPLPIP